MPINDDGDIIKACGFLAIYFGNLEEELDDLFNLTLQSCPDLKSKAHLRFKEKAKHVRKQLTKRFNEHWPSHHDKERIRCVLNECMELANQRNEILHSSIYGGGNDQAILKSRKDGERIITSAEVYDLANKVHDYGGYVMGLQFVVQRMPV